MKFTTFINYYENINGKVINITEEIPFEIPDNWCWSRLKNIGYLRRGNGIKRCDVLDSGFPCVRYGELYTTYKTSFDKTKSFTSQEIFNKSQKVKNNDILMALTGENKLDIATAVVYCGDNIIAMGGDMTCWSYHHMNPLFLANIINSYYGMSCRRKLASGDIIVHISNDKLGEILLPIAPLNEQNNIISTLNNLFDNIFKNCVLF